jgi:drug/metabolite transporter (DMT)-like permease
MYMPIVIIVLSNMFYHISTKSAPPELSPFAALTVSYGVGIVVSLILYFFTGKGGNLIDEYRHVNWSTIVLGLTIVGLEAGYMLLYRAGWNISTGSIVCSVALAMILVFVGWLVYHETISLSKVAGIGICLVGLYFINK